MIPNWLVQALRIVPFVDIASVTEALNRTDKYDKDYIELHKKFNEIDSKYRNRDDQLYEKITTLMSANLPFPSQALSTLSRYRDKLMQKRNDLRNDYDEISNKVNVRDSIIQSVKAMPSGTETEQFYNNQMNNLKGDKLDEKIQEFKTKIEDEV